MWSYIPHSLCFVHKKSILFPFQKEISLLKKGEGRIEMLRKNLKLFLPGNFPLFIFSSKNGWIATKRGKNSIPGKLSLSKCFGLPAFLVWPKKECMYKRLISVVVLPPAAVNKSNVFLTQPPFKPHLNSFYCSNVKETIKCQTNFLPKTMLW